MGSNVTTQTAVHTDYMGVPLKGAKPQVIHQAAGDNTTVYDGAKVPQDASIEGVILWVHHGNLESGYDPDRAKRALTAEHSRGRNQRSGSRLAPRKGLLAKLEKLLSEGRNHG